MDGSGDEEFGRKVKGWLGHCDYPSVRYVADASNTPAQRFNRMKTMVQTEYLWILAEGVIPPLDAGIRLLRRFDLQTVSVAAGCPGGAVWDGEGNSITSSESISSEALQQVGGNGLDCVIFRTSALKPHVFWDGAAAEAMVRHFYQRCLVAGGTAKLDGTVVCENLTLEAGGGFR